MAGIDDATKATMSKLPLCTIKAGPRDGEDWIKRVKEEYKALIQVRPPVTRARRRPCSRAAAAPPPRAVPASQQGGGQRVVYDRGGEQDRHAVAGQGVDLPRLDQVRVRPGVRHSRELPERGARARAAGARRQDREDVPRRQGARRRHRCCCGRRCCAPPARTRPRSPPPPPAQICLDSHFRPLWARNEPRFGIAHAMALGMGPWLAVEIPSLVALGRIKPADEK